MLNKKQGFTLIELLIVIGIIAILAAAIIVAISPGDQLEKARESTVEAQMQSIATAAYNCLVEEEGAEGNCGYGDLDLPDVTHPLAACDYDIDWSGGRVNVQEIDNEGSHGTECSEATDIGNKTF